MGLRTPLSIYVVFHPGSETSQRYADAIHDWFRVADEDGDSTEAGIPVWYRCALEGGKLAPKMAWGEAALNAVVVLVSAEMLLDDAWRRAVREMMTTTPADAARVVYPVALCPGASHLAWLFVAQALPGSSERVLRRALTEAVTRELRQKLEPHSDGPPKPPQPIQVFISHAKADGLEVARGLRDDLAKVSQLKTWFDENDIAPGHAWRSLLVEQPADAGTAVIAIVSSVYPRRNWCIQEASFARTPRPMKALDGPVRVFTVSPTVAVILPQTRWSRQLAQLAQVAQIGWALGEADPAARVANIVDRLLLETLLIVYYRAFAVGIADEWAKKKPQDEQLVLLTWVPDHWTLAHVLDELAPSESTRWTVAYPGRGLRRAEHEERQAQASRRLGERVRLVPQERLEDGAPLELGNLRVALSGGGANADVAAAGLGMRHVNDVMFRLSQRLLEAGAKLEFGGALSNHDDVLTKGVIAAAEGWYRLTQVPPNEPEDSPLTNYAAWPFYRFIDARQQAELFSVCRFVPIDPDEEGWPVARDFDPNDPAHARWGAGALSKMRLECSKACGVRVVFAGKLRGWSGYMPGILEEVALSLEANKPVLVIGGFGGMAHELARFLADPQNPWPVAATMEAALAGKPFQVLCRDGWSREFARKRFTWAKSTVERYREQLHGRAPWPYPVAQEDVLDLLDASSPADTIRRVLSALRSLAA